MSGIDAVFQPQSCSSFLTSGLVCVLAISPNPCSSCIHPAQGLRLPLGLPCPLATAGCRPGWDSERKFKSGEKESLGILGSLLLGPLLALLQSNSGHCPSLRPQHRSPAPPPQRQCFPDPGTAKLFVSSGLRWKRLLAAWVPVCFTGPGCSPDRPHTFITISSIKLS